MISAKPVERVQFESIKVGEALEHLESLFIKKDENTAALEKDPTYEIPIRPIDFVKPAKPRPDEYLKTPRRYQADTWGLIY